MTEMETETVERGYLRGCFRFLLFIGGGLLHIGA